MTRPRGGVMHAGVLSAALFALTLGTSAWVTSKCLASSAATAGRSVSGIVQLHGLPAVNAIVDAVDADDMPRGPSTRTDVSGRFELASVKAGATYVRILQSRSATRVPIPDGAPWLGVIQLDDARPAGENASAARAGSQRLGQPIEDFEDADISDYAAVGAFTGGVNGGAAHDGAVGLRMIEATFPGWIYRAGALTFSGDIYSAWVRPGASGRGYVGFGSDATGTFAAAVGVNTDALLLQYIPYGSTHEVLAEVPFLWVPGRWYRLEIDWQNGGILVGRVYDSDGTTLLAAVNALAGAHAGITQGGNAWRAFSDQYDFDSLELVGASVAVEPGVRALRESLTAFPNPTRGATTLAFTTGVDGLVSLELFDARGARVARLVDRDLSASRHEIAWAGVDARGRALPSGVYLARLSSSSGTETRRVIFTR